MSYSLKKSTGGFVRVVCVSSDFRIDFILTQSIMSQEVENDLMTFSQQSSRCFSRQARTNNNAGTALIRYNSAL